MREKKRKDKDKRVPREDIGSITGAYDGNSDGDAVAAMLMYTATCL